MRRVFIGLENINPDNLIAAKKRQNKITEYREMLQKWRDHGAITYAGYILGFPADTKESILRDIEIIKRELPIDILEFFFLTPLPGSEDHKVLSAKGVWMDPDLNKYDLNHRVSHHPKMSDEEWEEAYRAAWLAFYTPEHIRTILRRSAACPIGRPKTTLSTILWFYLMILFEGVHPLEGGAVRLKFRRDRRHGLPRENPLRLLSALCRRDRREDVAATGRSTGTCKAILDEVLAAPDRWTYTDLAIAPPKADEFDALDIYHATARRRGRARAQAPRRRHPRRPRQRPTPEPPPNRTASRARAHRRLHLLRRIRHRAQPHAGGVEHRVRNRRRHHRRGRLAGAPRPLVRPVDQVDHDLRHVREARSPDSSPSRGW